MKDILLPVYCEEQTVLSLEGMLDYGRKAEQFEATVHSTLITLIALTGLGIPFGVGQT